MANRVVYRYVNANVGRSPNVLLDDRAAVLNSVFNILNTEPGEREFFPEFGSILQSYLQDPIDATTATHIRYNLTKAIQRWEPRVVINQMDTYVQEDESLPGYRVMLALSIVGLDHLDANFSFYLNAQRLS